MSSRSGEDAINSRLKEARLIKLCAEKTSHARMRECLALAEALARASLESEGGSRGEDGTASPAATEVSLPAKKSPVGKKGRDAANGDSRRPYVPPKQLLLYLVR